MRRIAHLSDVHILDNKASAKGAGYRFATRFVSLGRQMDPAIRSNRLARALESAKAQGADHIVISGDLTEVGTDAEFERFAEVLHDAKLDGDSVTLVPGNHDAYTRADAWARAMAGPLVHFANASAGSPGKVVDRGEIAFLPIDTSCFQTMARSSGEFTRQAAEAIERRARDVGLHNKALVLVTHHPPFHPHRLLKWIDGLRGGSEVLELLARHPRLSLLHGHLHRVMDRILAKTPSSLSTAAAVVGKAAAATRMFGAAATCDDSDEAAPRIRLYDVGDAGLTAA